MARGTTSSGCRLERPLPSSMVSKVVACAMAVTASNDSVDGEEGHQVVTASCSWIPGLGPQLALGLRRSTAPPSLGRYAFSFAGPTSRSRRPLHVPPRFSPSGARRFCPRPSLVLGTVASQLPTHLRAPRNMLPVQFVPVLPTADFVLDLVTVSPLAPRHWAPRVALWSRPAPVPLLLRPMAALRVLVPAKNAAAGFGSSGPAPWGAPMQRAKGETQ